MALTKADRDAIQFNIYGIRYKGSSIGASQRGSVALGVTGIYVDVNDVEGFTGTFKLISRGLTGSFKATVKTNDLQAIIKKFLEGQGVQNIAGIHLGNLDVDLTDLAGPLIGHLENAPLTDRSRDFIFYRAIPRLEDIEIILGGEAPSEYEVEWAILPDLLREKGKDIGFLGDWTYVESTPDAVLFTADDCVHDPIFPLTAVTLLLGQSDRFEVYAIYETLSTLTFDLDGAIDGVVTLVNFDNLSIASSLTAGLYFTHGAGVTKQWFYITAVSYNAGNTSGTLTVVRGTVNNNSQGVIDNEQLVVVGAFDVERARNKADFTSSNPVNVKAGNLIQSTDFTDLKGQVTRLVAGAEIVSADVGGFVGVDLAVN